MQVHHLFDLGKAISIHALREEGDIPPCNPLPGWTGFLSTPSARRATRLRPWAAFVQKFLSTPSARRATKPCSFWRRTRQNFYPRPPRGGRQRCPLPSPEPSDFYPRPPRGGRPKEQVIGDVSFEFLSTPSARRATRPRPSQGHQQAISIHALREEGDARWPSRRGCRSISIHALREEGDLYSGMAVRDHTISIHALREEGDLSTLWLTVRWPLFLSTPSARRATDHRLRPHRQGTISIHALREEGDAAALAAAAGFSNFYPRPPRGGRPPESDKIYVILSISIHALREEGDPVCSSMDGKSGLFLSTPSARRATLVGVLLPLAGEFLSTPSARRATIHFLGAFVQVWISIHALREEGDCQSMPASHRPSDFYPRPPRGGRPQRLDAMQQRLEISIHALREEGDSCRVGRLSFFHYFYPRPPRGGRLWRLPPWCSQADFYPRPPRGGRPSERRAARTPLQISIHALREEGDEHGQDARLQILISIHALREEGDVWCLRG